MGWRNRNRPIAEPTSVNRVVPSILPSRQSNTQWNGLLRDLVDATLFRIGRYAPAVKYPTLTPAAKKLLTQHKRARKVAARYEAQLKRLGFGTDGRVSYESRNKLDAANKQAHEARVRAAQAIRAAAMTELVGTLVPAKQREILRRASKQLEQV